MSDWFVMATARNWVAAVVHQGNRVLTLQEKNFPPNETAEQFIANARERQMNPDFTHVEDHYFIAAVHKSVEWIVEAHNRNLLAPELTVAFLEAADQARIVRNIREHYLEYLNGGGRQRDQNVITIELNGVDGAASIDATSVMITDEGRLLGGRINVQKLMIAAHNLHPILFAHQNDLAIRASAERD